MHSNVMIQLDFLVSYFNHFYHLDIDINKTWHSEAQKKILLDDSTSVRNTNQLKYCL